MGFLEAWKKAGETIEEEMDERAELAALKSLARVAGVTVPFAVIYAVVLLILPLTAGQMEFGLGLLVPAIVGVAAVTLLISSRLSRVPGARFERAILIRSLWGWPVAAATVGLVDWVWKGDPGEAATVAAATLVGALVFGTIRYLWLSRRG